MRRRSSSRKFVNTPHRAFFRQISRPRTRCHAWSPTRAGGQDQFFNNAPFDIDNPKLYLGRNNIDHTNEVSFGGGINVKYGATIGFAGHFFSAPPTNLSIANSGQAGEIFRSDVTGDGTVGDILPGTVPGGLHAPGQAG